MFFKSPAGSQVFARFVFSFSFFEQQFKSKMKPCEYASVESVVAQPYHQHYMISVPPSFESAPESESIYTHL